MDGSGAEVGFVLPFFDFHYPDLVASDVKRVNVAIDLGFDLVNRIPQSGALAIAYGESFGELAVVVNAKENVPASRIGKGADFLAKFPNFRGDFALEFHVLAFSLGNQFQCLLFVNHDHFVLITNILISSHTIVVL